MDPKNLKYRLTTAILFALFAVAFGYSWQVGSERASASNATLEKAEAGASGVAQPTSTVDGLLTVVWGDGPHGETTPPVYRLALDDGTSRVLNPSARAATLGAWTLGGERVRVTIPAGSDSGKDGAQLTASDLVGLSPNGSPVPPSASGVSGSHPLVTLLCRFADVAGQPRSQSQVASYVLNSSSDPGLDHFWRENSYGVINLQGSAVPLDWVNLPGTKASYASATPGGGIDLSKLASDCTGAADATVNFAQFDGVVMMFNSDLNVNGGGDFSWGGQVTLNRDGVASTRAAWLASWADASTVAHETGHGFGLPHSWGGYGTAYGSPWDVMSNSWGTCEARDPSAPGWGCHPDQSNVFGKDLLGLFAPSNKFVPALNTETIVHLAPLDDPAIDNTPGHVMMVQVPSLGGQAVSGFDYYTFELRERTGYDINTPAGNSGAVVIHKVQLSPAPITGPATVLDLDQDGDPGDCPNPNCGSAPNDARWVTGETFSDPSNELAVTILDVGGPGTPADLVVKYGTPTQSPGSLRFSQQPSPSAANGVPFGTQPVVAALDQYGAPMTGDSSTLVALSVASGTGVLACNGGNTRVLSAGVAVFSGCAVTGASGIVTLQASASGYTPSTSSGVQMTDQLVCDAGDCNFDFQSGAPGWSLSGLWHVETLAQPQGMSAPALAYNQGCSGAGTAGCNYDTGAANSGMAVSPPLTVGSARLLTVKALREAGNSACGAFDVSQVSYSTDGGNTFQPFNLYPDGGITGGALWLSGPNICGDDPSAQTVSIVLPAGVTNLGFFFNTVDANNNANPGWFIDDLSFSVPALDHVQIDQGPYNTVPAGLPFAPQPVATLRTSGGAKIITDSASQVTLQLGQLASPPPPSGPAPNLVTGPVGPNGPSFELTHPAAGEPRVPATIPIANGFVSVSPGNLGGLTCNSLTVTAISGAATFAGCSVAVPGTGYYLYAATPAALSSYTGFVFSATTPLDCDIDQCAFDYSTVDQLSQSYGQFHIEGLATIAGMTSPMLAYNSSCTGPGIAGCTFDTPGFANYGEAFTPFFYPSGASRTLEFDVARDVGSASVCNSEDVTELFYSYDGYAFYVLPLSSSAVISSGGQYLSGYGICGNSLTAQHVTATLPAGAIEAGFYFYSADAVDNAHAGLFIDNVSITSGGAQATKLGFVQQPSSTSLPGTSFGNQPEVSVQDALGTTDTNDNSTVVTLSLNNANGASLACAGGLSTTVVSGVAKFAGCSVDFAGTGYSLHATSSPALTAADSLTFKVTSSLDCDAGDCNFDFQSGAPGWSLSGLWHVEALAQPQGISAPALAYTQGCSGSGTAGCNYDTGLANSGAAVSPPLTVGSARLLTFKALRQAGGSACGAFDLSQVYYSTDGGNAFYPFNLSPDGGITAGYLWLAGPNICGDDASAQTVSIVLPDGVTNIAFFFNTVDANNNGSPGWFIDDLSFSVPVLDHVQIDQGPYGVVPAGMTFAPQPIATLRTAGGARIITDNSSRVTLQLGQLASPPPPSGSLSPESPAPTFFIGPGSPTPEGGAAQPLAPPSGPVPAGAVPPTGALSCNSLTVTAISGAATFTGCSITVASTGYYLYATAPAERVSYTGGVFNADAPLNCELGQCAFDFSTDQLSRHDGQFHIENSATITGMTSPMLAYNTGCTGPGIIGCTFDTPGYSNQGGAYTPFFYPSGSSRVLQFDVARDVGAASVCGSEDRTWVVYTYDGWQYYAVTLDSAGSISSGGQFFSGFDICGNSTAAQHVIVTLPPGVINVGFVFFSVDSLDNAHAGVFIDNVSIALPATKLGFVQQPSTPTEEGAAFGTQPVVAVQDSVGNTETTDSSTVVTLSLNNANGATLSCAGGLTTTAVTGVASFSGCFVDKPGTNYTLHATSSPALAPTDSDSFTITSGVSGPTQLAFVQQPLGATYGTALPSQPVVAVEDGGNNIVTTDETTLVTLSAQGGAGTLSCTGGLTTQVINGQASFQGCTVSAAGNYTLHATSSPTLTAADSNSFAMTAPGGTTGLLRVTTSPGVPSQVEINGIPMDDWALNWVKLPPGQYTVSFSDLQGFTTPAPQTVTVTAGQTTTVQGNFIRRGNLRVVTSPPVPSTISVDGVPRNDWGVWTDLPAGSYQVCFGDVAGFNTPSCQTANLTAGQTTVITGTFTVNAAAPGPAAGYGLLRVTTSPAVPGQVLVDGVPMTDWGLDWVKLPPGTYTVSFTNIPNFTSPPPQVVTVTAGQTTTVPGNYVQRGFLRVITSPPVPGTISVNGLPREDWGLWTSVEPGSYQVCFGAAPGFSNTPTCQTQNVTVNTLTTFTGTYSP